MPRFPVIAPGLARDSHLASECPGLLNRQEGRLRTLGEKQGAGGEGSGEAAGSDAFENVFPVSACNSPGEDALENLTGKELESHRGLQSISWATLTCQARGAST